MAAGLAAAPFLVPLVLGHPAPTPISRAIRGELGEAPEDPIARFYAANDYRPLWLQAGAVRPEAQQLIEALRRSDLDGLEPTAYRPARLAMDLARVGRDPASQAHAEVALSRAYAAYVQDLRRPVAAAGLQFADPGVRLPPTEAAGILQEAARAPSLADALQSAQRMNPIYVALRQALDARLERGQADRTTRLIAANLERARALPPDLGRRYILVNPARQTLWLYAGGQQEGSMRVVVGKPSEPTPQMIGLIRYALFNPYWNVPPDLVRERIAKAVLRHGPDYLPRQRFEALSDWSQGARAVDPWSIDWDAVASGREPLRLRQRPGPGNMMGKVKFMLPNPLGVYLHDTPKKRLFGDQVRTDSAGCVRLQHPEQLAAWLFRRPVGFDASGGADQRMDLPQPAPVYIVYLTVMPGPQGLMFSKDIYHRDPGLLAALASNPHRRQ